MAWICDQSPVWPGPHCGGHYVESKTSDAGLSRGGTDKDDVHMLHITILQFSGTTAILAPFYKMYEHPVKMESNGFTTFTRFYSYIMLKVLNMIHGCDVTQEFIWTPEQPRTTAAGFEGLHPNLRIGLNITFPHIRCDEARFSLAGRLKFRHPYPKHRCIRGHVATCCVEASKLRCLLRGSLALHHPLPTYVDDLRYGNSNTSSKELDSDECLKEYNLSCLSRGFVAGVSGYC